MGWESSSANLSHKGAWGAVALPHRGFQGVAPWASIAKRKQLALSASTSRLCVELWGFEPQTSSMPWRRATSCAIAPDHAPKRSRPAGAQPLYRTARPGAKRSRQASVRSSLNTGSGRVPALCSTRRQPALPSSNTDQQQLANPPSRLHRSSGKPSSLSMPRRSAAP
jgi:hypothetical protein